MFKVINKLLTEVNSTFLIIYFSVYIRALASFLSAITGTITCSFFRLFLNS